MTQNRDIEGVDFAWLAVDDEGLVAIFMTGGEGPVPESAKSNAGAELDVEELLARAPEVTECRTHVTYPRPDDFLAAGRRGVFAFDWTDVHRTRSQWRQVYELVAEPEFPINLKQLPVTLQALARTTHLSGISFRKSLESGVSVGFVG
jgi:hypothetical protein